MANLLPNEIRNKDKFDEDISYVKALSLPYFKIIEMNSAA
jgi:hypothetical protein